MTPTPPDEIRVGADGYDDIGRDGLRVRSDRSDGCRPGAGTGRIEAADHDPIR